MKQITLLVRFTIGKMRNVSPFFEKKKVPERPKRSDTESESKFHAWLTPHTQYGFTDQ